MGNCKNCGGCGGCGGCRPRELELNVGELAMLESFCQYGFLPVARKASDMEPVYLEESRFSAAEYSLILQCLEAKGLIRIDYDAPLKGADMSAYKAYPVHGSMALTERGQQVLDILDKQGME